jgi:hypothetical protein
VDQHPVGQPGEGAGALDASQRDRSLEEV